MASFVTRAAFAVMRSGLKMPTYQMEQFLEAAELKSVLDELKIDCVVDVGANVGQFAERLRLMGFKGRIASFEPSPDSFAELKSRASDLGTECYDIALGSSDGEMDFHRFEHSVLNSFHVHRSDAVKETIKVRVRRLDGMIDAILKGALRPLLKLDTQGFDLEVVKGAGDRVRDFLGLTSEISVHAVYEGAPHFSEALKLYESLGFKLRSMHPVFRGNQDLVLEYNALMIR